MVDFENSTVFSPEQLEKITSSKYINEEKEKDIKRKD